MLLFEYVLILLAAVMLSNLINRFAPVLSAPILQIILGVLIGLIHQMFEAGRISRESAKEMRGNIAALQARLQAE